MRLVKIAVVQYVAVGKPRSSGKAKIGKSLHTCPIWGIYVMKFETCIVSTNLFANHIRLVSNNYPDVLNTCFFKTL